MSLYMDSADLCLTKPGGISITEAVVKKLPMVFVNAVAGCEQYNMDFFVKMGAAVTSASTKELAKESIRILESEARRQKMADALNSYRYPGGAEKIFHSLEDSSGVAACGEPGKEQEKLGQRFPDDMGDRGIYEKRKDEEQRHGRLQSIQVS